jgi:hypothetical protein
MNITLVFLQLLLINLAIFFIIVGGSIYHWFRNQVMDETTEESLNHLTSWFWIQPVETGVLEVSFAATATAIALPVFIPPGTRTSNIFMWIFQCVILTSSFLGAISSLWLYRIYVQQQAMPSKTPNEFIDFSPQSRWSWIKDSGPYSLLGISMMFLLIGLCLLVLIIAIDET